MENEFIYLFKTAVISKILVNLTHCSGSQTFSNGGSLAKSRFFQGSQCQILRSAPCTQKRHLRIFLAEIVK